MDVGCSQHWSTTDGVQVKGDGVGYVGQVGQVGQCGVEGFEPPFPGHEGHRQVATAPVPLLNCLTIAVTPIASASSDTVQCSLDSSTHASWSACVILVGSASASMQLKLRMFSFAAMYCFARSVQESSVVATITSSQVEPHGNVLLSLWSGQKAPASGRFSVQKESGRTQSCGHSLGFHACTIPVMNASRIIGLKERIANGMRVWWRECGV